ncbi:hypothetical protein H2199_007765 [Coniosporium tulheliwenetii]|uniref:Uncharacterized protein n=1 Tax=Coniosporium tulheliwenetii TaxID=3383036 RepID=A0ACC2YNV1_9PEZI|nr:hypothetical protein H2199_007765 [Cladosporium sp. JES 115]
MLVPTFLALSLPLLTTALPAPSTFSSDDTPLPLIIWHGLGDNYAADGLKEVGELAERIHPGTFVYNIRLNEDPSSDRTATFLGNLTLQIAQVCANLAAHPILSTAPAVDALGFSQGGQFLRAYVERCNNPPVRSLVTFGAQHNGIADFQACGATDWLCKGAMGLLRTNTWTGLVQSRVVPAQYYREVNVSTGEPTEAYLAHSNFLADTYAANLASLEKFVMYVFEKDVTVIPKESGWFAEVNKTSKEVTPLRNRTMYTEDWLGLKRLDEKKGLVFREAPGAHMELSDKILAKAFKEYFGPLEKEKVSDVQADVGPWEL